MKLLYKFCVNDFACPWFDTKRQNYGMKNSRKIRNLRYMYWETNTYCCLQDLARLSDCVSACVCNVFDVSIIYYISFTMDLQICILHKNRFNKIAWLNISGDGTTEHFTVLLPSELQVHYLYILFLIWYSLMFLALLWIVHHRIYKYSKQIVFV